jgi:CSLREA domain-containing protein
MANFVVDTLADAIDGNTSAGDLSLREAIALANANPGADTITFAGAIGGQTIVLNNQLSITTDVSTASLRKSRLTSLSTKGRA